MSNSHDSRQGHARTNSGIWVIVLVVVLLALLVVPILLGLWFVGAPAVSEELGTTINSANNSVAVPGTNANVSVNGAIATVTSNGVTITALAESGQWRNSQITSSGSRVEARLDTQTIVLKNSQLSINNVEYGAVQQGDQVRLEGGSVIVNGQERNPAEGAAASTATSEPEQETAEQAP